jgi:hypothetical protein
MELLKKLLLPIVDAIQNDKSFEMLWDKEGQSWK